ncbi:hypothetical protein BHE74_00005770 [Ensete ventricosum]|uniref:Uncharacterized protein n=1 Tax=Ensete ventricosum TaxID=4639 RepID=A0A444F3D1_ENSVE|nr:hypothetical protein GW17_00018952 [Ensete ventricosum]RWW85535.1 hypothetical protein BHE74_00005770 [Ensete ventricosum]RZR70985.1 hypothetical protein BHM03_00002586 [Ensete ventricosum]
MTTFAEIALAAAWDVAEVPHPPGPRRLPPDRLHAPVIWSKGTQSHHKRQKPEVTRKKREIEGSDESHLRILLEGSPQAPQRLIWRWKLRRTQRVWVLFLRFPKLPVPFPCKIKRSKRCSTAARQKGGGEEEGRAEALTIEGTLDRSLAANDTAAGSCCVHGLHIEGGIRVVYVFVYA